ncbi:exosortase A [Paraurantiacibacter namhicola]|uniref:Transmembrane exosortase n=1 Tax=Paraurantiacibacter namhicola TaxID=645517 RepID=A0A1C7D9U0_9SPHN|nr:exosortase A [Paraurantiacibacter namhicola]ANU08132.1 Transmembrane exosortase [Paraurantiacibacter namhicola]
MRAVPAAMRRDFALKLPVAASVDAIPQAWRVPLLRLCLAWTGLFAFTLGDWADMAAQWWDISTYNHILLVPPIIAWLVYLRAGEMAQLVPMAWWPGLVGVAGALFVWLLGTVSGLNFASQLGSVLVLQAAALTLLGPKVSWALFFPLCYMLFLVPFGDELVPALQMVTAAIVIWLTEASGIPAVIEGVFIDTPVGLFEVAEACSGVKFLIAMIALGALVAHVCFTSWKRRALFMAMAAIIPILANGIRAWGTIYIAQSQGLEFAEGFDHIFYGWVFFAIVLVILLGAGWRFFERWPDDPYVRPQEVSASRPLTKAEALAIPGKAALMGIALMALGVLAWSQAASTRSAPMPQQIALPQVEGWDIVPYEPPVWWEPRAAGNDHRLLGRYRNADGEQVDVFYALYASQGEGREAGGFNEGALPPATPWRWSHPGPSIDGGAGAWLQAYTDNRRYAVTWYRSGDLITGSNARLKLANMLDKLALRSEPTMLLILSAQTTDATDPEAAIARFRADSGPLAAWMDGIAQSD